MNRSVYDLVKSKSDIVKTVGSFLEVQKKGSVYVALCPFHKDTRPSMSVNPSMNIFKCFVCGAGGNPVGFVFKYLNLARSASLEEAVKRTAQINGITLPKDVAETLSQGERKTLSPEAMALDDLAGFYRMELRTAEGARAMDYLRKRGMGEDALERFGIGYAPRDATLAIRTLREKKKVPVEVLENAGILAGEASSLKDRYSERIMFPLKDAEGHAVGFSGRKYLPDDPSSAKYVNSPETDLFKKSALLYNFDNASMSARKDGFLYVTEGFMDVVALYRAGITSAVALMGTNLSREHLGILKKLGVEIRLCLDGDAPGREATKKCLLPLTQAKIPFKVTLPFEVDAEGKDADEFLERAGKEALLSRVNRLVDPILYAAQALDSNKGDYLKDLDAIVGKLSPNYAFLSPSERELLEVGLAKLSGVPASSFRERLSQVNATPFQAAPTPFAPILTTPSRSKYDGQVRLTEFALKKQREWARKDGGWKTLFNEAQILARLLLSYQAVLDVRESGFRFSSSLFRLIATYVVKAYGEEGATARYLDGKGLDAAREDFLFHVEEREKEGANSLVATKEVDALFANLNLLTPSDYKEETFQELLSTHSALVDEQEALRKAEEGQDIGPLVDLRSRHTQIKKVKGRKREKHGK